jgi:hypothetical protein
VKHVQRQLIGGFPTVGDPHDSGEDNSMHAFVQRMQCTLISGGDGLDEANPVIFGYGSLRPVGIQQIAEGCGLILA